MARSPTAPRITGHRISVQEYHRMAEAGVWGPEERVELVDGEVLPLAPIDSRHSGCVNRLTHLFFTRFGDRGVVAVQSPIEVDDYSEPQPDLVLLRPRADFYSAHHGLPPDTLLVIEVANTSLRYDLGRKRALYLARGVPEVWVVDVVREVVHVATAAEMRRLSRGDSVTPTSFPDDVVTVVDILGPPLG